MLWTDLVKQYIYFNKEGTALDILLWIDKHKKNVVMQYIQSQMTKPTDWGGIDCRYLQLMHIVTISKTLEYLFQKGEIQRKSADNTIYRNFRSKWIYFEVKQPWRQTK